MRVVFMGTPDFAVPTLARLAKDGHDIVAVYTRAPARAGRGMSLRPSPVHAQADALGVPVLTPSTLRTPEAAGTFSAHRADVAVVVAYGMLLPQTVPRCAETRLPQPPRLPAAALARGRSDPARRDGGRRRERRRRDADGGRARHGSGRPGGAAADHAGHDRRRVARRPDAARGRADGPRPGQARAGAR